MLGRSLLLLVLVTGATATSPPANSCQACRSLVSYARTFNSTSHREEHKDMFRAFCERYYPASTDFQQGPCPMFVEGLFFVLDNTDPIRHCDQIGACGSSQPSDDIYEVMRQSDSATEVEPPHRQDEVICQFCTQLVDQVKASLSNPRVVDQIKQQADELCDYLKVIDQDKECKHVINNYLDVAVSFIQHLDAEDYCASIKICPARATSQLALAQQRQLPTLVDFKNFGIETSVSIGAKPLDSALTGHRAGPACQLCKTIVKELFHFLRDNKTEENIMAGLDQVCHLLYPRGPKLDQCQSMVKAYTREIVQLLVDETDPEVVCMLIEQCVYDWNSKPPRALERVTHVEEAAAAAQEKQAFDLAHLIAVLDPSIGLSTLRACVECKLFVRYLKERLESPRSREELKEWLMNNLCAELPAKDLASNCSSMVERYSDVFFKAVAGNISPQAACVDLGVCSARASVQVLQIDSPSSPALQSRIVSINNNANRRASKRKSCTTCVLVVSQIDEYLSSHTMGQDVASLSKVCDNTYGSLTRRECGALVQQYGADIVQLIPTMENPRQLCNQIDLCA